MLTILCGIIIGVALVFLLGVIIFLLGGVIACLPIILFIAGIILLDVLVLKLIFKKKK